MGDVGNIAQRERDRAFFQDTMGTLKKWQARLSKEGVTYTKQQLTPLIDLINSQMREAYNVYEGVISSAEEGLYENPVYKPYPDIIKAEIKSKRGGIKGGFSPIKYKASSKQKGSGKVDYIYKNGRLVPAE